MMCSDQGKEVFELLLTSLKDNKTVHINIIWSTMGLQIAAIGWLLTSGDTRQYLAKHKKIVWLSLFAIGILLAAHIGMVYDSFYVSEGLVKEIRENVFFLECIEKEKYLSAYRLNGGTVGIRLFFTLILFAVLATLIISTRGDFDKKNKTH
ncbi:MAG: hypothetical protein VKL42_05955 [Snowella sp.]|nr:hypothetical protein [Snowella sp.]